MAEEKKTTAELHADLKTRKELLEIELMEQQLSASREAKEKKARDRERQEFELKASREQEQNRQTQCYHHSGGVDSQGMTRGDDNRYSVIKHTYPNNQTWVMCSRCLKTWKPGDPDYAQALSWPTLSSQSSADTWVQAPTNIPVQAAK